MEMGGQLFLEGMWKRDFLAYPQTGENVASGYGCREPFRGKPAIKKITAATLAGYNLLSANYAQKVLQSSRQVWASHSQAFDFQRWSWVLLLPSTRQPEEMPLQENLFEGAFFDAEIAPLQNAFFSPDTYQSSVWPARGI